MSKNHDGFLQRTRENEEKDIRIRVLEAERSWQGGAGTSRPKPRPPPTAAPASGPRPRLRLLREELFTRPGEALGRVMCVEGERGWAVAAVKVDEPAVARGHHYRLFATDTARALGVTIRKGLLHSDEVRDLAFNPNRSGVLLSGAKDKAVVLTSVRDGVRVHKLSVPAPVWAVGWSPDGERFTVATQRGQVLLYDARNARSQLAELSPAEGPGVSRLAALALPGLSEDLHLAAHLKKVSGYWGTESATLLGGSVRSVACDPASRHLLATTQAPGSAELRHQVLSLGLTEGRPSTSPVEEWSGVGPAGMVRQGLCSLNQGSHLLAATLQTNQLQVRLVGGGGGSAVVEDCGEARHVELAARSDADALLGVVLPNKLRLYSLTCA